jgi:hypothetical protein
VTSDGTPGASEGFAEARRFQLRVALALTPGERLRALEALLDFNDMVLARNPQIRRVAERLRPWLERRWRPRVEPPRSKG